MYMCVCVQKGYVYVLFWLRGYNVIYVEAFGQVVNYTLLVIWYVIFFISVNWLFLDQLAV